MQASISSTNGSMSMPEAGLPPAIYRHAAYAEGKLVWLTSFPKSGNTWTRILVGNFVREPDEDDEDDRPERIIPAGTISSNRPVFDDASGLSSSDLTPDEIDLLRPAAYRHMAQRAEQTTVFIKSHDAYQINRAGIPVFPPDSTRGAIVIVRHPMDVALSYAHHMGHSGSERSVRALSDPRHTMAGEGKRQIHQLTMGWSGHYLSWTRQDQIPVFIVRYEDLLADTATWFGKMLHFLGIEGADDTARIENAVALSRFDRLQAIESREGFREIPVNSQRFFRSGRSGEGIETLSPELRQRILDQHGAVMAELGYSQDGADPL